MSCRNNGYYSPLSLMYNFKLLLKLGAIYNLNDHSRLGLNITTSSLTVFGRGSVERYISHINVKSLVLDSIDINEEDQLVSDFGRDFKANFKSPFSIALGYNIEFERDEFGIAIEYFNDIEPYKVITGEETGTFINTKTNMLSESDFLDLTYGQRSIVNIAYYLN